MVHGGIISTILDEAMAWATAHAGVWAVTGEMRVRPATRIGELTNRHGARGGVRGRLVNTAADSCSIATARRSRPPPSSGSGPKSQLHGGSLLA